MNIEKDQNYIVPGEWLLGLKRLEKWLYQDAYRDSIKQPGKIRDWANWLNGGFFRNVDAIDNINFFPNPGKLIDDVTIAPDELKTAYNDLCCKDNTGVKDLPKEGPSNETA